MKSITLLALAIAALALTGCGESAASVGGSLKIPEFGYKTPLGGTVTYRPAQLEK